MLTFNIRVYGQSHDSKLWTACEGQGYARPNCTRAYNKIQNLRYVACAFAFLAVILYYILFVIALRFSGHSEPARRRISPWTPSFIKTFARRLSYRNGGHSNLLSIRIPLLSLKLIDIILWAVLFALYRKWIPKTWGLGLYIFHGEREPPSGYDISITLMLILVTASFVWTSAIVFRPLTAASQLRIGYYIGLEFLCSTVLLSCGIVAFWWNGVVNLRYVVAFNELCITIGPPIPSEAQVGPLQCEPHMKMLQGLKFSALVFVYLMALLHLVLCIFACHAWYKDRREKNHMHKIGSEIELPIVTSPGRDGLAVEQGIYASQERVSEAVPAEWGK